MGLENIVKTLKKGIVAAALFLTSCMPQYAAIDIGSHKTRGDMPSATLTTLRYGLKKPEYESGFGLDTRVSIRDTIKISDPGDPVANEAPYDAEHNAVILDALANYQLMKKGAITPSLGAGLSLLIENQTTDVDFGAPIGTKTFTENPVTLGITANLNIDIAITKNLSIGTTLGAAHYFGDDTSSQNTTYSEFTMTYTF